MRYPSKYVLVTDVDDPDFSLEKFSESCNAMQSSELSAGNDLGNPLSMHLPQTTATILPERVWQDCIIGSTNSHQQQMAAAAAAAAAATAATTSQSNDDTSTSSSSSSSSSSTQSGASPSENNNNNTSTTQTATSSSSAPPNSNNNFWDLQDPTLKTTCTCTK